MLMKRDRMAISLDPEDLSRAQYTLNGSAADEGHAISQTR